MTQKINWKDIWDRAKKTFAQAFIALLISSFTGLTEVISMGDKKALGTFVVCSIVSAVASGVSAAWNVIKQVFDIKEKEKEKGDE